MRFPFAFRRRPALLAWLACWQLVAVANGSEKRLSLHVLDDATGRPTPARFSLELNGIPWSPDDVGPHGLRFISHHDSKRQVEVVLYARGTFPVEMRLPATAKTATVHASKGFEFLPVTREIALEGEAAALTVRLRRWSEMNQAGWFAADAHLHYDRFNRNANRDWFAMMKADDLQAIHFMMLRGGKVPGEWSRQYAYGKAGMASDGERLITAGEEYRDTAQGHINLLGMDGIIEPVMAGRGGLPNFPPLHDVFVEARRRNALAGVAHGASLGSEPTAVVDAVLGQVDFFEIGNTHLFAIDTWYHLLNCGFVLPPVAGTDLPNYPGRDPWQPFLGEVRTYVRLDEKRDFEGWKGAVKSGKTFVTSGPMLTFTVDGVEAGGTVRLPEGGGRVVVRAELSTPRSLRSMELIRNGEPLPVVPAKSAVKGIARWRIETALAVEESCWFAIRGAGVPIAALDIESLRQKPWHETDVRAHSGIVSVLVGGHPIRSSRDAGILVDRLDRQKRYYGTKARYARPEDQEHMLHLFDRAREGLLGRRE